jgi:hypothetical protein
MSASNFCVIARIGVVSDARSAMTWQMLQGPIPVQKGPSTNCVTLDWKES